MDFKCFFSRHQVGRLSSRTAKLVLIREDLPAASGHEPGGAVAEKPKLQKIIAGIPAYRTGRNPGIIFSGFFAGFCLSQPP